MTFLEAAIEILRSAEGALHFSEVTRRAVEGNLLSHVGRDPEAAMRSCLNSAARTGRNGDEPLIIREKPGYYAIRPGAKLPDPPPKPVPALIGKKSTDPRSLPAKVQPSSSARASRATATKDASATTRSRKKAGAARTSKAATSEESTVRKADKSGIEKASASSEDAGIPSVEFEAPTGSGLDGVTDVALVMANAVSRLVEERPELKDELDAMQQRVEEGEAEPAPEPAPRPARSRARELRETREREREARERDNREAEERGGRRRRRRRRRGKRVEWAGGAEGRSGSAASATDHLLDGVASVLEESGARSLHIRQIAETLAQREVLGGEISEIERAVTAAILSDIRQWGRSSRFEARGEARYQLQGARLPEKAARAERALRDALRTVEQTTREQFAQWLQSLGARALESLVRIYLQEEGYRLLTALPPGRGTGRLVVEDPDAEDDNAKALVLVIPRRTQLEPKLWEGDLERNGCGSLLVFAMGEGDDGGEGRLIGCHELADWLLRHRVGVTTLQMEVPVLDPTVIESVTGLDT